MTATLTAFGAATALARRSTQWLNAANGSGPLELTLRLLKVAEEFGEVCEEVNASNDEAAAREAVDVIVTAMVAQVSLGGTPAALPVPDMVDRLNSSSLDVLALMLGARVGELAGTVIGEAGQNPRKGRHKTVADVIAQLDQVIAAAVVLIAGLGYDPEQTIAECAAKVQARLDQLGVPVLESGVPATDPLARCPSRIAHASGVVIGCRRVAHGPERGHWASPVSWRDDDDRVISPATSPTGGTTDAR